MGFRKLLRKVTEQTSLAGFRLFRRLDHHIDQAVQPLQRIRVLVEPSTTDHFAGFQITHIATLDTDSFNLGLLFYLTSRNSAVVPYVGIGGGYYDWRLAESGDFIDFSLFEPRIISDTFVSEGGTFGYYYLVGLVIPLSRKVSVFAEGRWQRADDDLDEDFEGFGTLDLGGQDIRAGVAWRF